MNLENNSLHSGPADCDAMLPPYAIPQMATGTGVDLAFGAVDWFMYAPDRAAGQHIQEQLPVTSMTVHLE